MNGRLHHRIIRNVIVMAVACVFCTLDHATAQSFRRGTTAPSQQPTLKAVVDPALMAKLTATYQASVDGKPLRELLAQIATAADFNLWIDRNVDPDHLVSLSGGPKTVFAALQEASQGGGAEVVAVGNVVLVGHRNRLEQLAGAILALPPATGSGAIEPEKNANLKREIRWPIATTPTVALRVVLPETAIELPHDHWPEVVWRDVSERVAALLVTSQFDLMPIAESVGDGRSQAAKTLGQIRGQPQRRPAANPADPLESTPTQLVRLEAPPVLTLRYPSSNHNEAIRAAALAADPRASLSQPRGDQTTPATGMIELAGAPAAHLAAITAMLKHASPRQQTAVDIDTVRFTLNLRAAPAQDVLLQLAAAGGRRLQITDQATPLMRRTITFDLQDQTLRQLVKAVTDQMGADARWTADTLVITLTP
jgi:hypothetical protein